MHDVCFRASFKTPSCFATLNTTLPHFLLSKVSALTFEVANANLSLMLIVFSVVFLPGDSHFIDFILRLFGRDGSQYVTEPGCSHEANSRL